jgi:polyferredoxin
MVGLGVGIATRTPLRLDVIRDRNALYRETNQGLVENVYTLKVINMAEADRRFSLEVDGLDGAELILDVPEVAVRGGEVLNLPARVRIDPEDLKTASSEVLFKIEVTDRPDISVVESARFIGPSGG